MTRRFTLPCAIWLVSGMACIAATTSPYLHGDEECAEMRELTLSYLACERLALNRQLGLGEAMQCSVYYETLKDRRFDADAAALRAWYGRVAHLPLPDEDSDAPGAFEMLAACE